MDLLTFFPTFVKIVAGANPLVIEASVFASWPSVKQLEVSSSPSLSFTIHASLIFLHRFVFYVFQ